MITEKKLVDSVGCHPSSLRKYRAASLEQGVHWVKKGRTVHYTKEGAEAVREWRTGGKANEYETAIILKEYPNPNLIRIEFPDGRIANCRVKQGRWAKGRQIDGLERLSKGLYLYMGNPPRK